MTLALVVVTGGGGGGDELIIIVGTATAAVADSYPVGCVLDRGARGRIGKRVGRASRGVVSPRPPRAQIRMMEPPRDCRAAAAPLRSSSTTARVTYITINHRHRLSAMAFCFYIYIHTNMHVYIPNIYQLLLIIVVARASSRLLIYIHTPTHHV